MRITRLIVGAALCAMALGAAAQQPVKIRVAYVVPVANWASLLFQKDGIAKHNGKS